MPCILDCIDKIGSFSSNLSINVLMVVQKYEQAVKIAKGML
ncbi:7724_t:CDS:2 [Cetraspora pellucida]|uniref:7724_t:CDS:1 n=1 Tax=Cetraspora pellucida TaxID=1433469 RepID=A0A9N9DK32_9GLOM|nr:7724_t:CDS:2 [Cetraspora pellucida]